MKKVLLIIAAILFSVSLSGQSLNSLNGRQTNTFNPSIDNSQNIENFAITKNGSVIEEFKRDPLEIVKVIVIFDEDPLCLKITNNGQRKLKEIRNSVAANYISEIEMQHSQFRNDLFGIQQDISNIKKFNSVAGSSHIIAEYKNVINGTAIEAANAVINELRKLPYVKGIYPVLEVHAVSLNNSLENNGVKNLNNSNFSGKGIIIGIVDSGIDYTREDLGGGIGSGFKVLGGYDFVNNDSNPMDDNGHGTAVSGVAAANGISFKGAAPDAKLYALKALNSSGIGDSYKVISAIDWAMDPNNDNSFEDAVDVLNFSLGSASGGSSDPLSLAIDNAVQSGIVCVVAAGNDGGTLAYHSVGVPASSKKAICVGAIDSQENIASFSSKGPAKAGLFIKPEIVAPGVGVTCPDLGGQYTQLSGTSLSAPYITGYSALLLEQHPNLDPDVLKAMISQSAKNVSSDYWSYGFGVIDTTNTNIQAAVTPATVDFGAIETSGGNYTITKEFTAYNFSASSQNFSASLLPTQGVNASFNPQSFLVEPGSSKTVSVTFNIDRNSLANTDVLLNNWLPYSGEIQFQSGSDVYRALFSFVICNYLKLNIKEESYTVLHDRNGLYFTNVSSSRNNYEDINTYLLPDGAYDIVSQFDYFNSGNHTYKFVVIENLDLSKSIVKTISSSDAKNSYQYNFTDEIGNPLNFTPRSGSIILEHKNSKLGIQFSTYILCSGISDLTENYRFEWYYLSNPNEKPFYSFKDAHNNGINNNILYPDNTSSFQKIKFKYRVPSGIEKIWMLPFTGGYIFGGSSSHYINNEIFIESPFENEAFIIPDPSENFFKYRFSGSNPEQPYMRVLVPSNLSKPRDPTSSLLYTTPWYKIDNNGIVSAYFYSDNTRPVLVNNQNTITYGLGPTHWYGKFENSAGSIKFKTNSVLGTLFEHFPNGKSTVFYPLFLNQYQDAAPKTDLSYKLFNEQGTQIKTEVLNTNLFSDTKQIDNTSFIDYKVNIPITQGKYSLEIADENSPVNGTTGRSKIIATMDTRLNDKNPPSMTSFNILADNEYSDALGSDQNGQVQFAVDDQEGNVNTQLFYKRLDDNTWNAMAVNYQNGIYVSDISSSVPKGYISLKVLAIDASNNQLEYTAEPAFYNMATNLKPEAVILASPSNNTVLQQTNILLKWNQSNLAENYHLQISADSLFINLLNDYSEITTTEKNITGLANNKTYYWRVSAVNSYGAGEWSQMCKFNISIPLPAKPQLVYPGDLANYLNTSIYVKWKKVDGILNYKFELSSDSSFASLVINDSTLTDTTKLISTLKEGKKYYWRVSAKGIAGTGSWSDIHKFTTLLPGPSDLSLERIELTEVKLKWKTNSVDENGLLIERKSSKDSTFSIIDTIKNKSTSFVDSNIQQGSTYWYRLNCFTNEVLSFYSNQDSLEVITITIPTKPALVFPENNKFNIVENVTIIWNSAKGADYYKFECSYDSSFSSVMNKDTLFTDTSKTLSKLEEGRRYYWRVQAKNLAGMGDWSDIRKFTTLLPRPTELTLERTALKEIKLSWKINSKDEEGFILERKNSSNSNYFILDSIKAGIQNYSDKTIEQGTTYWYRINAYTKSLVSEYSDDANIVITKIADEGIPDKFSLSQNYPNPFNPRTLIKYGLKENCYVILSVYNIIGQKIYDFINTNQEAGFYVYEFDGSNLPSGVYIYSLKAGDFTATKKFTLIK